LGLLATISIFLVMYWPSIAWVTGEWSDSSGVVSHGYLIAVISGYLLLRALNAFAIAPMSPLSWLLPIVVGLSVIWLLAYVANVAAVQTAVLPIILLLTIAAAFGVSAGRTTAFAILYLYFGLPALNHLQFIFQAITTNVVHVLIRITGLPAYIEENFVFLPVGTFEIAAGCAGLAFILAALSLAVLYGHLHYNTFRQAAILIAISLAVAMLGNWIRVFTIVSIGHFSAMQSPLVDNHLTFGWFMFAVLMVPVFFVARRLESREPQQSNDGSVGRNPTRYHSKISLSGLFVAIAALCVGPVWNALAVPAHVESDRVTLALPDEVAGWTGPLPTAWDWQPRYSGVTAENMVEYRSSGVTVLAYTNVYLRQQQGSELVFFDNDIAGSWRSDRPTSGDGVVTVNSAGDFRQVIVQSAYGSWLIWYRYEVGGTYATSDMRAKIVQAFSTLRGKPEAGVVAYAILCQMSCEIAETLLANFVAAMGARATSMFEIEES